MESDDDESMLTCDTEAISFLRYFMTNRQMEEDSMIRIYKTVFKEDKNAEQFREKIAALNETLESSNLKIQDCICEVTGQNCYVLISTYFRPDTILPSLFNDSELEFIKNVIHEIIISDLGMVSAMKCLHLPTKLTVAAAESLLKKLVAEKWLSEPRKGKLVLSALAISELKPYIEANYKTVMERCIFCKRTVHFGEVCVSCKGKGHTFCVNKYAKSLKKNFKCPSCGTNWSETQGKNFEETMECDDTSE